MGGGDVDSVTSVDDTSYNNAVDELEDTIKQIEATIGSEVSSIGTSEEDFVEVGGETRANFSSEESSEEDRASYDNYSDYSEESSEEDTAIEEAGGEEFARFTAVEGKEHDSDDAVIGKLLDAINLEEE